MRLTLALLIVFAAGLVACNGDGDQDDVAEGESDHEQ